MLIEASGTAVDGGGGCVASVEVSWEAGEWHPADIAAVGPAVAWSLRWGLPWQRLHGAAPEPGDALSLRVSDDSGNAALFPDAGSVVVVDVCCSRFERGGNQGERLEGEKSIIRVARKTKTVSLFVLWIRTLKRLSFRFRVLRWLALACWLV